MSARAIAQVPEDALKFSFYPQNGTARNMAVGGAMGSLGGDITAVYVNPAGLAFFRTGEAVISGSWLNAKNTNTYRKYESTNNYYTPTLGASGIIGPVDTRFGHRNSNTTVAVAINQTVSFHKDVSYSGMNNYSSFAETFAEEFSKSQKSIDEVLTTSSPYPFTSAPALYTYLIDTVRNSNGQLIVRSAPEMSLQNGNALKQTYSDQTKGGIYELAVSAAHFDGKKLMVGATLGIPLIVFKRAFNFSELDTTVAQTNFRSFSFHDSQKTTGAGANLKIGMIYKPVEYVRLGLAVNTPSVMMLSDTRTTTLATKLSPPYTSNHTQYEASSSKFNSDLPGKQDYLQMTAWRFISSASYVIREIEDVTKQRGFITADVEYVTHGSGNFMSQEDEPTESEKQYYKDLGKVVKNEYKSAFNFKVGGELKFNTIMARLGAAYYSNPYRDAALQASKTLLSGGLGYRNKGIFIDLTYVHNMSKDVNFPYRLAEKNNTFASTITNSGLVMATFGVKF